jgi:hypothetical protein
VTAVLLLLLLIMLLLMLLLQGVCSRAHGRAVSLL